MLNKCIGDLASTEDTKRAYRREAHFKGLTRWSRVLLDAEPIHVPEGENTDNQSWARNRVP
jgi:hypothetical protein